MGSVPREISAKNLPRMVLPSQAALQAESIPARMKRSSMPEAIRSQCLAPELILYIRPQIKHLQKSWLNPGAVRSLPSFRSVRRRKQKIFPGATALSADFLQQAL